MALTAAVRKLLDKGSHSARGTDSFAAATLLRSVQDAARSTSQSTAAVLPAGVLIDTLLSTMQVAKKQGVARPGLIVLSTIVPVAPASTISSYAGPLREIVNHAIQTPRLRDDPRILQAVVATAGAMLARPAAAVASKATSPSGHLEDASMWHTPDVQTWCDLLVRTLAHIKLGARRAARTAVSSVLTSASPRGQVLPLLEEALARALRVVGEHSEERIEKLLASARSVLPLLRKEALGPVVATLLSYRRRGRPSLVTQAYAALTALLDSPRARLSLGFVRMLTEAALESRVAAEDTVTTPAFSHMLAAAVTRLAATETLKGGSSPQEVMAAATGQPDATEGLHPVRVGGAGEGEGPAASGAGAAGGGGGGGSSSTAPSPGVPLPVTSRLLPRVVRAISELFASGSRSVQSVASNALAVCIQAAVTPALVVRCAEAVAGDSQGPVVLTELQRHKGPHTSRKRGVTPLEEVAAACERSLTRTYEAGWPFALSVVGLLFQRVGREGAPLLVPLLKRLVGLRGLLLRATQGVVADSEVMGVAAVRGGGSKAGGLGWGDDADDGGDDAPGVRGARRAGSAAGSSSSTAEAAADLGMDAEGLVEAAPALRQAGRSFRAVERALGAAVRCLGAGGFLRVVPLHTTALLGDKHYSPVAGAAPAGAGSGNGASSSGRSGGGLDAVSTSSALASRVAPGLVDERVWVIKLLKKHARLSRGELLTFRNVLMPAAWQCHLAAKAAEEASLLGNALQMRGRMRQIWGLLPSLCAAPTDAAMAFAPGGKFLDDLLGVLRSEAMRDLHAAVCSGLGVLIVRHRLAVGLDAVGRPEFMGGAGSGSGDGSSVRTGLTGATGNDALTFLGGVTSFYLDADASTIGGMSRGTGGSGSEAGDDARSTASGGGRGGSGTVIPLGQRHPSLLRAAGNGLRVPVLARPEAEAGIASISAGARKLLPQLLTTYQKASAAEEGRAQRVLECVAAYFAAAPTALAAGVFKKALERMTQSIMAGEDAARAARAASSAAGRKAAGGGGAMVGDDGAAGSAAESPEAEALRGASARAASYLSLALAMVPRLPPQQCGQLWVALRPAVVSDAIKGQQKRAYKVMASLLQTHAQVFLADAGKIQAVAGLLRESKASCAAGSLRLRLRCLRALARALDPEDSRQAALVQSMLREAIPLARNQSKGTREGALQLVVELAHTATGASEASQDGAREDPMILGVGLRRDPAVQWLREHAEREQRRAAAGISDPSLLLGIALERKGAGGDPSKGMHGDQGDQMGGGAAGASSSSGSAASSSSDPYATIASLAPAARSSEAGQLAQQALVSAHKASEAASRAGAGGSADESHDEGPTPVKGPGLAWLLLTVLDAHDSGDASASAGAVLAIARLLYEFSDHPLMRLAAPSLLHRSLGLLRHGTGSPEVARAVSALVKVCTASLPPETMRLHAPRVLEAMLEWARPQRSALRTRLRILLERLMRRYGEQAVAPFIPKEDAAMFRYVRRMMGRKTRRREAALGLSQAAEGTGTSVKGKKAAAEKLERRAAFDALLDSDAEEEEMGGGDDALTSITTGGGGARSVASRRSGVSGRGRRGQVGAGTYLRADDSAPIDLLSSSAARHLVSSDPASLRAMRSAGSSRSAMEGAADDGVRLGQDGRILVDEESEEETSTRGRARGGVLGSTMAGSESDEAEDSDDEEEDDDGMGADATGAAGGGGRRHKVRDSRGQGKGKRKGGGNGPAPAPPSSGAGAGGDKRGSGGLKRDRGGGAAHSRRDRDVVARFSGKRFASKKAGGDAIRKGQTVEPFAYVPLDPRALSGKGGGLAVSRFEEVVQGGKGRKGNKGGGKKKRRRE